MENTIEEKNLAALNEVLDLQEELLNITQRIGNIDCSEFYDAISKIKDCKNSYKEIKSVCDKNANYWDSLGIYSDLFSSLGNVGYLIDNKKQELKVVLDKSEEELELAKKDYREEQSKMKHLEYCCAQFHNNYQKCTYYSVQLCDAILTEATCSILSFVLEAYQRSFVFKGLDYDKNYFMDLVKDGVQRYLQTGIDEFDFQTIKLEGNKLIASIYSALRIDADAFKQLSKSLKQGYPDVEYNITLANASEFMLDFGEKKDLQEFVDKIFSVTDSFYKFEISMDLSTEFYKRYSFGDNFENLLKNTKEQKRINYAKYLDAVKTHNSWYPKLLECSGASSQQEFIEFLNKINSKDFEKSLYACNFAKDYNSKVNESKQKYQQMKEQFEGLQK